MEARTVFKFVAVAGVPVTGYLSARGARKCERLLRQNGEPLSKMEKAKDFTKSYWPALIAGGATIGSILISDNLATKAITAAAASATLAIAKKDVLKGEFESYRNAVKEDAGAEKDVEYLQKASEIRLDDDGEVVHTFKLTWLDKPIYFESTMGKVQNALNNINRELFDYNAGMSVATVSDALTLFGHDELRTKETDMAGWSMDLLSVNCDCYWLDFYVYRETDGLVSHGDEDPNTYIIDVVWPPEDNLKLAIDEAFESGVI